MSAPSVDAIDQLVANKPLTGRTAVVTGGSRGIGLATAERLLDAGANVVITARNREGLDEATATIERERPDASVLAVAAHAGREEDAEACFAAAVDAFGGVDILVNNAATNPYMGPLVGIDASRAAKTHEVNLWGPLLWSQVAWRAAMHEHGGNIINISSIGGLRVDTNIGYYNVTKAALNHLTRQLAYELAPKVRVNAIAPSLIKTEMARAIWEPHEERIAKLLPAGRLGTTDDVAAAVLFLVSDAASWITGQVLVLDGGALVVPIDTERA